MTRSQHWFSIGLVPFFAILLSSCSASSPVIAQTLPSAPADFVPQRRDAGDAARFLAGLPGDAGSPFAALEANPAWKEHRSRLDEAWRKAEITLIRGLREFQRRELNGVPRDSVVFYPFSGPDSLTVTLCFPHSPVYVNIGLEPAGTLPTLEQIQKKDLPTYLAQVRGTMASELGRSFFITREMDRQFRGQVTDGLLLPILQLLVRTQNKIDGFRYVRLDDDGRIIDRDTSYKAPGRFGNKGVEIEFRSEADRSIHKLLYFAVNLSDERLKENQPFLSYVSGLHETSTLLKATSYMMHREDFSTIRDVILSSSAAILQDDSGIPFRWFRPDLWNVQLYGDYTRPYGSFGWLEQSDLRKAYKAPPGAKPLALRIGYGYSRIPSNLLFAWRPRAVAASASRKSEVSQ